MVGLCYRDRRIPRKTKTRLNDGDGLFRGMVGPVGIHRRLRRGASVFASLGLQILNLRR